jgi:hypothetical protein
VGGRGQRGGELSAGGRGGARHVVQAQRVQRALDGAQDLPAPRPVHRQLVHQLAEHLQVLDELPDLGVEDGELGLPQPVQRRVPGGERVPERGDRPGDQRVGRRLHEEPHLATGRGQPVQPHRALPRVQPADRGPVGQVDQALGGEPGVAVAEAEIDDRHDVLPRPAGWHRPVTAEPGGAPWPAPGRAHLDRLVVGREPFGRPDRLAGRVPGGYPQRRRRAVHRGTDPLPQHPVHAPFGQQAVVMHEICSSIFCSARTGQPVMGRPQGTAPVRHAAARRTGSPAGDQLFGRM